MLLLRSDAAWNREYEELEMKMQETFQKRVDRLQEQVRQLQQRYVLDVCDVWCFTFASHCNCKKHVSDTTEWLLKVVIKGHCSRQRELWE